MNRPLTLECAFRFERGPRSRKEVLGGGAAPCMPVGRVPRIAKLMALAIRFDQLVRTGQVADHADLARLGGVTRARMSQIMSLLHLAPQIQEELLHLPRVTKGRDPVHIGDLRTICSVTDWPTQKRLWNRIRAKIIG